MTMWTVYAAGAVGLGLWWAYRGARCMAAEVAEAPLFWALVALVAGALWPVLAVLGGLGWGMEWVARRHLPPAGTGDRRG